MVISLIKNFIPDKVRIPAFIVVIASFVTIVQMLMQAFVPALYASLGVFIPLIVVNCIILGRAEAFASKNCRWIRSLDGRGHRPGLHAGAHGRGRRCANCWAAAPMFGCSASVRRTTCRSIFVLAHRARFLVLGYLMVVFNKLAKK